MSDKSVEFRVKLEIRCEIRSQMLMLRLGSGLIPEERIGFRVGFGSEAE